MSFDSGDKEITCSDCGQSFVFTDREQAFFQEKGFNPPKRCKTCRDKKKQDRRGGGGGRYDR